ncbi:MAG: Ig-like domain-containing protein [Ignavibacteriaceae bacterium]|nr:Ig-like domain-containing protein [Ignavibacteriaceae bacterium]
MVKPTIKKLIYSFGILSSICLMSCANQQPPGGGPVDTVPPKIVEVFPANGTTNFSEDYFELSFSEYVDKRSLKDAIFISPRVEGDMELNWSGQSVQVSFPEKLKKDITYNITIGTDVVDYNNKNRMAEAFTFSFSTGAKIDNGIIEGNVYSEKPSGVMIFAYKVTGDTINPVKQKADYVSQVGEKGNYKLSGLSFQTYRVFAVQDEYRDFLFQPDQDLIGVPFREVTLNEKDTLFRGLNFSLFKIDTISPRLFSAVMTDKHHLLVTFSEELDSVSINAKNFSIVDSTDKKEFPVLYAFKGRAKEKELFLAVKDSLATKNQVYVTAQNIEDEAKNKTPFDAVSLTVSDRADTSAPTLMRTFPAARSELVDFLNTEISFWFDNEFDVDGLKQKISFNDTLGNIVYFSLKKIDDASFVIRPTQKLKSSEAYTIKFNFKDIVDVAGNHIDSLYQFKFKTFNGLNFTGFSGVVENLDSSKNPVLVLQNKGEKDQFYSKRLDKKGEFAFTRVEPGKYNLYCFYDTNNDGKHSSGFPFPFQPSEEIKYYKEEINLPPRWEVTDFKWDFAGEMLKK